MGRNGTGKSKVKCQRCGKKLIRYQSQIFGKIFCSHECRHEPIEQRFWSKIDKSPHPQGCWLWTASTHPDGYGQFGWPEKNEQRSHRIAWILTKGNIPKGMKCLHNCPGVHNPTCCNPDHLYLGTQADNVRDAIKQGTHVKLCGTQNHNALLNESIVREIRANYKRGAVAGLAKKFKISIATVRDVAKRRSWKHVP